MAPEAVGRICRAMISLLQKERLEDITVKELVAEAGVSRSSYNYHFYSLNGVVERIVDDFTGDLVRQMTRVYLERDRNDWNENIVYSTFFRCVYEERDMLRTLKSAGFMELVWSRLAMALEDFFSAWAYRCAEPWNGEEELKDGMVYNLKNRENAYRLAADFLFWAEYDYSLPADYMSEITETARKIRFIAARTKK